MTEQARPEESEEVAGEEKDQDAPPEQGNPTDGTRLQGSVPSKVHEDERPQGTSPPGTKSDGDSG
jgi:hypothetical protein